MKLLPDDHFQCVFLSGKPISFECQSLLALFVRRFRQAHITLITSEHLRAKVIGIVLSGLLGGGTEKLKAFHAKGGPTVVQDPKEAAFSNMPSNILRNVHIDYCMPIADIAALILRQCVS